MTGVQTCALPICFPVTICIEKAKKSIQEGKSEASAWKLAEAEKADAYRKFAEQVKQVEDEIYGMTHSSFDTNIHSIERREEDMRDAAACGGAVLAGVDVHG